MKESISNWTQEKLATTILVSITIGTFTFFTSHQQQNNAPCVRERIQQSYAMDFHGNQILKVTKTENHLCNQ
jgi:hypothetical protein